MRISDWSSDVCSSDLFLLASPANYSHSRLSCYRLFVAMPERLTYNSVTLQQRQARHLGLNGRPTPARHHCCAHGREQSGPNAPESIYRRSEEHTSELQSLMRISYAVFCLKKKTKQVKQKIRDTNK